MDLVDKEHIVLVERGEQARQVARLVEHWAAGDLEPHAQLIGDDVAQRRLAQARRAVEQDMIQRLATLTSRLDKHPQVVDDLVLTGKVAKPHGPEGALKILIRTQPLTSYVKFFCHLSVLNS